MEDYRSGWPWRHLDTVWRLTGIDTNAAQLLRVGHCAAFALAQPGLLIRVARPGQATALHNEIAFARSILSSGHFLMPWSDAIYGQASIWPLAEQIDGDQNMDWHWLGATLRKLHTQKETPYGSMVQPATSPLDIVHSRVKEYGRYAAADPHILQIFNEALRSIRLPLNGPHGLIHGDAHPGNVVRHRGDLKLIDYDLAGWGCPTWDAIGVLSMCRHYHHVSDTHVEQFAAGYGADPRDLPDSSTWVTIRELLDASSSLLRSITDSSKLPELWVRASTIGKMGGDPWTAIRVYNSEIDPAPGLSPIAI